MQYTFHKLPDQISFGKNVRAIVACATPQVNGRQFLKYEYIDNSNAGLQKFMQFASKFPGCTHCNFYSRITGQFIEQVKF